MTLDEIRTAVAQGWTDERNAHKEMDVDLAEAIAQSVWAHFLSHTPDSKERKPWWEVLGIPRHTSETVIDAVWKRLMRDPIPRTDAERQAINVARDEGLAELKAKAQ